MRLLLSSSAVFLGVLLAGAASLPDGSAGQPARGLVISVPNIPGPYCMYGVEKRLMEMPEVQAVRLSWEEEELRVDLKPGMSVTREEIEAAIERAEYPYEYAVEL